LNLAGALAVAAALLTGVLASPVMASAAVAPAASQAAHPDLSGWWYSERDLAPLTKLRMVPPPLRDEWKALFAHLLTPGVDLSAPGIYCQPFRFVGDNGGGTGFEILFTPGRTTLINENRLVRRIYTDGRKLPADPDPDLAGTSVGRWEGDTFVVETTGIDPVARFPAENFAGFPEIGEGARIDQRFRLVGPDLLQVDTVIIAPRLFTGPYKTSFQYKRDRAYEPKQSTSCVLNDRSVNVVTGKQQFDMTPPADLPPPPPD
jgi:hypothetical protein